MKTLEDVVVDKIYAMINYMLSKVIKPDIQINKVTELDERMITKLKQQYGIEGIILDVDETLRKNMRNIPEVNQKWIQNLKGQLKVIVVSNGKDGRIEQFFRDRGIDYIGFAHKPLRKNFIKACEKMNIEPEKVLVIGDSLFNDIHGGNKNSMKTVIVKNVEDEGR